MGDKINLSTLINSSAAFVTLAAREWLLSLTDQPTDPPFQYKASFDDESERIARLIVVVIILSGVILGAWHFIFDKTATLGIFSTALKIICGAFILALIYKPIAYAFGIPISLRQILFTVLYMILPWLPVLSFIWGTVIATEGTIRVGLILSFYVCFLYITYNFIKAVQILTRSNRYRIWLSLCIPIVAIIALILFRP